ncbi:MAG: N-acetylmuramoyl-L-alanine amidase [Marinicaulis sp.]|nr:N-acetylmuramoyl-L-alanine amidase [Marinicaulis sp.]NNL90086.1 N-acetylmuramoyl-L-alanine amidase [Marinicaulis sp.]
MTDMNKILAGIVKFLAFALFSTNLHAAELIDVRFGPERDATRIVFDLRGEVAYSVAGDAGGNGRLILDFVGLSVSPVHKKYRSGEGHIERFGFADSDGKNVRAVFDFAKTAAIREIFSIPPSSQNKNHRLVIDLETSDKNGFLASIPSQYPDLTAVIEQATAANREVTPNFDTPISLQKEVAIPPRSKYIIVIDAGHGGKDPGAHGQNGTLEKNVTLAAAKELKEILEKRKRFKVVLTRDKDVKVDLEAREPLARKAGANLFISLHADALANANVRGGSVYTLSDKGTTRAIKIAKSEGNYRADSAEFESQEVADMVLDLSQNYTRNESSKFAKKLLAELSGKTPLLNRSLRQADLRVLLAPDVPTVLFEMAYISHKKDEANLNSKAWRKRTMTAVADSIDAYFDERELGRVAENQAGGAQ